MELRDFAEQVLFATTLEEKLRCPEIITDERPGSSLVTPDVPGRPAALRFKPQGAGKADFPGVHRLEQERERGRLLHFFANHELLATELMALVLLRFPDAPTAFRRGVWQTLKDEQEHTRWYIERMAQCGIQFGDLPVSGYFWRAVSTMENPMDYVAGLSLTFEQANLDFARHFARGFAAVGDADSARLLEKIYRDEISHVAYGLKWLRRWKNPSESDWEAFCRQLKFPLSPSRAKGTVLNVEGRRAAGLEPEFIDELNVHSQSKGRTPSVFVFNPFAEAYIAQGKAFTPVKHQAQLARDLANLPQFLCRQDDIVLVEKRPSVPFLSGIKQAGFALPEFVELSDGGARLWSQTQPQRAEASRGAAAGASHTAALRALAARKLGTLRPWAWGPDSMELLAPLLASVSGEERTPEQRFNNDIAQLYSKAWSAAFLRKALSALGCPQNLSENVGQTSCLPVRAASFRPKDGARMPREPSGWKPDPHRGEEAAPYLCTENEIGVAVDSLEQALSAIALIRERGHHQIIVKEARGLAGHNAIRLWERKLLKAQRSWIAHAVENRRQLVIEPWLERELDFSVQLEMTPHGLKLCGYTGLINDRKGQFQANWAAPNYARRIPDKVTAPFHELRDISARLHELYAEIISMLEEELRRVDYLGPIGIDAFVYRTPQDECRLKPIAEINPRYTMGRLTVELMKQTGPGSHGLFRLVSRTMARSEGFDDFPAYARSLAERFPLRLAGEPVPKIREGVVCLNDPDEARVCLAVFHVNRSLDTLMAF